MRYIILETVISAREITFFKIQMALDLTGEQYDTMVNEVTQEGDSASNQ